MYRSIAVDESRARKPITDGNLKLDKTESPVLERLASVGTTEEDTCTVLLGRPARGFDIRAWTMAAVKGLGPVDRRSLPGEAGLGGAGPCR